MVIEQLAAQALGKFETVYQWNTLQPQYTEQGWPLKLPDINWTDRTRLVLHFQDRITPSATGCRELETIERRYGSRASQVIVIFYSHGLNRVYKGPVQLVEFSTHNWLTVTDLITVKDRWQGAFDQPKTQAWQCLNGRICDHRKQVASLLRYWPQGTLSLGNEIALPQWSYSTYRGTENYDNFVRLLSVYGQHRVNIVTETDYVARPGVISEKTLYAFVAKQIPIVIAYPGAVQDCRDMGFDMLDDLVDHSYDWMPNERRVQSALDLNRHLILGEVDVEPWQSRMQSNHNYVFTGFVQWMTDQARSDLARVF